MLQQTKHLHNTVALTISNHITWEREDRGDRPKKTGIVYNDISCLLHCFFFFHYSKSSIFGFIHIKEVEGPILRATHGLDPFVCFTRILYPSLQQCCTNYDFCTSPYPWGKPNSFLTPFRTKINLGFNFFFFFWGGPQIGPNPLIGPDGGGSEPRKKNPLSKWAGFGPQVLACGLGLGMEKPSPNLIRCHSYV